MLTLIRCLFHTRVTALTRNALKQQQQNKQTTTTAKPGHCAKSAGRALHLNTHSPMTQRSRSGLIMPLSRHFVGTNPETSSHASCQGTFGHSRLISLGHTGAQAGNEWSNIFPKSSQVRKKAPRPPLLSDRPSLLIWS